MREFELLEHVYASNPSLGGRVIVPPGDDMALLQLSGKQVLAAVDQLVGGRHFDPQHTPLELIGRKAITRCLSDVAAMAARPVATMVAVTLPADFGQQRATDLFDAMRVAAALYDCPLVGGDIAMHADPSYPLVCSVTVLAEPGNSGDPGGGRVVRRDGARPGDALYVTGALGGSLEADGGGRHLTFEPRIEAALELRRQLGDRLHAMIDISDGLGRDAGHLAHDSAVTIEIDSALLPCHGTLPWRRAATDGEDYELLFAAAGDGPASVAGVRVTQIGRVLGVSESDPERESGVWFLDGPTRIAGNHLGWQHES